MEGLCGDPPPPPAEAEEVVKQEHRNSLIAYCEALLFEGIASSALIEILWLDLADALDQFLGRSALAYQASFMMHPSKNPCLEDNS